MTIKRWSALVAAVGLAMGTHSVMGADQSKAAAPAGKEGKAASAAVPSPNGPWIGTWKRNAEKSSGGYVGGGMAIFKMWVEGDGFRYTLTTGKADAGEADKHVATAFGRFDGKPYPEKGNPSADFNVFQRVDDHTYALSDVKDGKETMHFKITFSADGKTRTSEGTGKSPDGKEVKMVGVWDRVE
jgi:hypothetical protein